MMMIIENNPKCGDFTLLIDFIRGLCPVVRPGPPHFFSGLARRS